MSIPAELSVTTDFADFGGHQTWYRVTGRLDPDAERAPVVILHGRARGRARLHARHDEPC